jgi:hypothetical protein
MQQRRHLRSTRRHEMKDNTSTNVRLQLPNQLLAMEGGYDNSLDP